MFFSINNLKLILRICSSPSAKSAVLIYPVLPEESRKAVQNKPKLFSQTKFRALVTPVNSVTNPQIKN